MRKFFLLSLVVLLLIGATLPAHAQDAQADPTIAEFLTASATDATAPEFTILWAALQAGDPAFLDRISNPDTVISVFTTLFAPTDAAFMAAFEEMGITPEEALADTDTLNAVLSYHIMPGIFTTENFAANPGANWGTFLPHVPLVITTADDGTVLLNDAKIVEGDIPALSAAIHVIDKVLIPPMGDEMGDMMETPDMTIYEILESREDFSIFKEAMDLMGFQLDLNITNYTLFLPTDAVFEAFFEQIGVTKEDLFANTDTITPILFYHFLSGTFYSSDIAGLMGDEGAVFGTQQPGTFMTLTADGDSLIIDGGAATVTEPDIMAKNGVIHVIDSILLPSGT